MIMSFKNKISKIVGGLIAPMFLWALLGALLYAGTRLWFDLILNDVVIVGYQTGFVVDYEERGIFWKSNRYVLDSELYTGKGYCAVSEDVDHKLFCAYLDDKKVRITYEDSSFFAWQECDGERFVVNSVESVDGSELACEY